MRGFLYGCVAGFSVCAVYSLIVALRHGRQLRLPPPPAAEHPPVELVVAQRRIGELTSERDDALEKLAGASRTIAETRAELRTARSEQVELRRHRRELARAVRNRSSLGLAPEVLELIEAEGLAE